MLDLGAWVSEEYKVSGGAGEEEDRVSGYQPDEGDLLK